jgi:hypothetical protein
MSRTCSTTFLETSGALPCGQGMLPTYFTRGWHTQHAANEGKQLKEYVEVMDTEWSRWWLKVKKEDGVLRTLAHLLYVRAADIDCCLY